MSLTLHLQQTLGLSNKEADIIQDLFSPVYLSKGEIFIQPIDKLCSLYYITEGYVRIYALHDGKEITQWIGSPEYFMTDLTAWLFNTPIKWYIEAITPVKGLYISKKNYSTLASKIDRWYDKERLFIGHCFEQMEMRIFQFIALTAELRYLEFCDQLGYLFNEVPHHYIASMLGMSPETLSRIRKKTIPYTS